MPSSLRLSVIVTLALTLSCSEDPPVERHYPMREPTHAAQPPVSPATLPSVEDSESATTGQPALELRERPKPDPAIAVTLDLISASKRRFIDQADGEDSRPTEYTSEQFASMLRSKWDWLGYDIVTLEPWLDDIATRSFKSNLPYLVVLEDGSTVEFRGWLDTQRAQATP
jgi:hypothetical protein